MYMYIYIYNVSLYKYINIEQVIIIVFGEDLFYHMVNFIISSDFLSGL